MTEKVSPMLATLGTMPKDQKNYGFEFKWDGYRGLCFWDGKKMLFRTRNHLDITPECSVLIQSKPNLGKIPLLLDGEIVALNLAKEISFSLLQEKFRKRSLKKEEGSLFYMIFDILYIKDRWVTSLTFKNRRLLLEKLPIKSSHWKLSPCKIGTGDIMLKKAKKNHIEGLMAKRLESNYQIGMRSHDWIKIKLIQSQEFVIGGWMPPKKGDQSGIGSLMLGFYKSPQADVLKYVGNVGTGFNQDERDRLKKFLVSHSISQSPFGEVVITKNAVFAKPLSVCEVEFRCYFSFLKL